MIRFFRKESMLMSLFFLQLSILTYFLTHYWAKKTKPEKDFSFGHIFIFQGNSKDFKKKLETWILSQKNLKKVEDKNNEMILSSPPSVWSYGYFYHFQWVEKEKHTEVVFCVQPKLVSMPNDRETLGEKLSKELELKDVS